MAYKKQKNVNIDALIAREDFEAADETTNTASKISTLSVNDLKEGSGLFLASVRKPDFQRETADWDIDKIVRFIKSFVDGEFIPAVILWRSQAGLIFVIDGYSHKLYHKTREQFYRNFGLHEKSPNSFLPGLPRSIINQFRFHNLLCLCLASVHLPHPFHLVFGFQLLGHAVLLCQ